MKGKQNQKDNLAAGYHNDKKKDQENCLQNKAFHMMGLSKAILAQRDEHLQKDSL